MGVLRPAYRVFLPPGIVLNALNRILQMPVVTAVVQAIYWCLLCLATALFAPVMLLAGVLEVCSKLCATETPRAERAHLAVVITGCDSGFGKAVAHELLDRGYTVFAGCLYPPEPNTTAGLRLHAFKMDVTSDTEVNAAEKRVSDWLDELSERRLLAVVNNAGVGVGGMFDWIPLSGFERDAAINYIGCVRVCKAFLPLLRKSALVSKSSGRAAPRILVVSSMSGKLPVPLLSSYSATKHAVTAFAASLRMELSAIWGIHVCTVLPSFHRTPLTESGDSVVKRVWEAVPTSIKTLYGEECATSCFGLAKDMMSDWAWDPLRVTEAITRVVSQEGPPPCELVVGSDALFGLSAVRHLPPAIYEKLIWWVVAWNLVKPNTSSKAKED